MAVLKGIIDDGTRKIPLENEYGKLICNIYLRPSDYSILDRYQSIQEEMKDVLKPLEKLDIKADGTSASPFEEEWAVMKEAETNLKAKINWLFDMDEADDIFAKRNPFSSVGGKFFCENVIEVIGDIIVKAVEEEKELSKKRISKYMDGIETEAEKDDRTASEDTRSTRKRV